MAVYDCTDLRHVFVDHRRWFLWEIVVMRRWDASQDVFGWLFVVWLMQVCGGVWKKKIERKRVSVASVIDKYEIFFMKFSMCFSILELE